MKFVKIILLAVAVLLFYFTYLFIPNKINISGNDYLSKAAGDPNKGILQIQYWDKWMPYKKIEGHSFIFEHSKLEVQEAFLSSAKSVLTMDNLNATVILSSIDAGGDSTFVRYECIIDNRTYLPTKRVQNYLLSKKMEAELQPILKAAKVYYEKLNTQDSTSK